MQEKQLRTEGLQLRQRPLDAKSLQNLLSLQNTNVEFNCIWTDNYNSNWVFHKHTVVTILELMPTLYSHTYLQFPSLFPSYDAKCKIRYQYINIFQGCILHWYCSFLISQLKQSWQNGRFCVAESLWKTLIWSNRSIFVLFIINTNFIKALSKVSVSKCTVVHSFTQSAERLKTQTRNQPFQVVFSVTVGSNGNSVIFNYCPEEWVEKNLKYVLWMTL